MQVMSAVALVVIIFPEGLRCYYTQSSLPNNLDYLANADVSPGAMLHL
jgi:hypothetical protein